MRNIDYAETLVFNEIMEISCQLETSLRSLKIGDLIKMLRKQIGIPQSILSRRSGVPQSTISMIENNKLTSLSVITKLLKSLHCNLTIVPTLQEPIEQIRKKQANKIAKKHLKYLKGTMSLEDQKPDDKLFKLMLQEEEKNLLRGSGKKLWEEEL
ncbi:MAG: helix-turn-helix domain-containing protein [Rhabdochlamydiaceae bacterium]|nr:helix-turn-helix domain-containing protein [Candidatus Amphrikana amoebophyrae]